MSLLPRCLAAVLAAAILFAPAVDAQIENPDDSTPTTLYFHIFDTFNKFVINTQQMDVSHFEVGGTNFPTATDTPANEAQGAQYDFNTIYGTSTAGPVEYDFIENGKPRFHPEPGIAQTVQIDDSVDPMVYFYIDVRDITGVDDFSNVLPDLTVRVTMREGDDPGPDAALDEGELIMSGQKTATLCSNGEEVPVPVEEACTGASAAIGDVLVPDEDGIVEFALPMELAQTQIPKAEAFNIRIDWWQEDPSGQVCGEDQCAEGFMRLAADENHLPRLEMNILNPIFIEFIHPQVAAGTLLIHTGVNSPWGTYDVDADNITLSVSGPSSPQNLQQVVAQNQHVHGLHDKAAEITYLWKFRDEGAANGEYTINMEVPNMAGNAVATGQAGFTIEGKKAFGISDEGEVVEPAGSDDSNGSPGIGALAVLGLLGAALFAARRK